MPKTGNMTSPGTKNAGNMKTKPSMTPKKGKITVKKTAKKK